MKKRADAKIKRLRTKEPKLNEPFYFETVREWQLANQLANELGLRSRIEFTKEYRIDEIPEKILAGKWVKNEPPSERS